MAKMTDIQELMDDIQCRITGLLEVHQQLMNAMSSRSGWKLSDETRAKMSASRMGMVPPREHIERLRDLNTGSKHTDEAKAKMRDAWARRKAKKLELVE